MLYSEHPSTVSSEFFWVTEILDAIGSSDYQCVERETRRASGSPVTMCVGSTFSGQELTPCDPCDLLRCNFRPGILMRVFDRGSFPFWPSCWFLQLHKARINLQDDAVEHPNELMFFRLSSTALFCRLAYCPLYTLS